MWTVIQSKVDNHIPNTLVLDIEPASSNAFVDVFGVAIYIVYCFFHFRKALRENLGDKHCLQVDNYYIP